MQEPENFYAGVLQLGIGGGVDASGIKHSSAWSCLTGRSPVFRNAPNFPDGLSPSESRGEKNEDEDEEGDSEVVTLTLNPTP